MPQGTRVLGRLKRPEYTGENRCLPCTVVNTIIAVGVSAVVGVGVSRVTSQIIGLGTGFVSFGFFLGLIVLRGYLIPGTPELTKRYFPKWLLALFGKRPAQPEVATDIDTEAELVDAGALGECRDGEDLCLTREFRDAWYEEIDRVEKRDSDRELLLDLLDLDEADVDFREYGAAFQAYVDGNAVGKWESKAAFLADLAAAAVLTERHARWGSLSVQARSQLLSGLRLFIDTCPACGGEPTFGTDTVESCCSTREVAAVSCPDCDARLFETPVDAVKAG